MNTAIYLRVSTEDQAREGISMDMQRDRLQAYCVARGWKIVGIWEDTASGKTLDRPAMQNLLSRIRRKDLVSQELAREGKWVEAVLVYKLDRLTRSVRDLAYLLEEFQSYAVSPVSMSESIDATTATGRLMVHIIGSVAQWEREQIGERTKAVMQHRKKQGLFNGGEPPFGFTVNGTRLAPSWAELRIVREIFKQRQRPGYGPSRIARALEPGQSRTGRAWHHEQVRRVLNDVDRYRGLQIDGQPVVTGA